MEGHLGFWTILATLLGLAMAVWGGYYFLTGVMSLRNPMDYGRHTPTTRFAILIAARNEGAVIGALVESLLAQDYPKELFDVWVIPNNCTDHTAQAALQAGAKVLECTVPVKSKGEVLNFAHRTLKDEGYDAFCVFDADNVVDPQFLREMNHAYRAGARVAQGYRDSKNPYDTTLSGCYSIYYWMMCRFHNQGKAALGLSALVNGTGFMISHSVLEQLGGWRTHTISEDLEVTIQCALRGIRVHWVPKAITYDEQPLDYALSVKQRKRWCSGTLQVSEDYLGRTVQAGGTPHRALCLDMAATMLIPAYQVTALANLLLTALAVAVVAGRFSPALFLGSVFLQLGMTLVGGALSAALVLTLEHKWDRRLWKSVCLYGLFLLSWLPITLGAMAHKTTVWEEIRHTRNVSPVQNRASLR